MTVFQALVLGLLQGLSEFLPVSSSAHLTLAPWLFHWSDPGLSFDVALHAGTLIALVWYFRAEWVELIRAGFRVLRQRGARDAAERRVLFLIVGTIPAVIAGLALQDYAETTFRSPRLIAITLIVMGIVLWLCDRFSPNDRPLAAMRWRDAIAIGVAQALALIPGVSRSGATISSGRVLRFDRQSAAVFSFLLSFPVIAGASVLEVPEAIREMTDPVALAVGVLAAAVSSWIAIAVLLRFVVRHSYGVFALYRVLLGALVLGLVASGR